MYTAEIVIAIVLIVGVVLPIPGRLELKVVQTGSMMPTLPVGSLVAVVPAVTYNIGDIITFSGETDNTIPITHRVAGIVREGGSTKYVTKGDANNGPDVEKTAYRDVLGKVAYSVPHLGSVLDFIRSRQGFVFTVGAPTGLIVFGEIVALYGARRKRREASDTGIVYGNDRLRGSYPGTGSVPEHVSVSAYAPTRIRTPYTNSVSMDGIVRTRVAMHERIQASLDGYTVNLRGV
jgi:signal peptidase